MINKKYIISSVILIASIGISIIGTYGVKSNADEQTLTDVKQELQQQIDEATEESSNKDKQIEELNTKISEQQSTIDNLNTTVNNLSGAVSSTQQNLNNTQQDLSQAKTTQKKDKEEVQASSDAGDASLQKQVDAINNTQDKNVLSQEQRDAMKGENDSVAGKSQYGESVTNN